MAIKWRKYQKKKIFILCFLLFSLFLSVLLLYKKQGNDIRGRASSEAIPISIVVSKSSIGFMETADVNIIFSSPRLLTTATITLRYPPTLLTYIYSSTLPVDLYCQNYIFKNQAKVAVDFKKGLVTITRMAPPSSTPVKCFGTVSFKPVTNVSLSKSATVSLYNQTGNKTYWSLLEGQQAVLPQINTSRGSVTVRILQTPFANMSSHTNFPPNTIKTPSSIGGSSQTDMTNVLKMRERFLPVKPTLP